METLKSGDAPALVTNIEVMQILSERIESRKASATANEGDSRRSRQPKRGGKLQHCDWIEEKVHAYLRSTPCGDVDIARMPQLVAALKDEGAVGMEQTGIGGATDPVKVENAEDQGNDHATNESVNRKEGKGSTGEADEEEKPTGFGLTDAETLQMLNLMPGESVDIHLLIEDLPSRLSEERQAELLNLVGKYAGGSPSSGGDDIFGREGAHKELEDEEIVGDIEMEEHGSGAGHGWVAEKESKAQESCSQENGKGLKNKREQPP